MRIGVARREPFRRPVRCDLSRSHLVARQLQINRTLVPDRRGQHPIDLAERSLGPVQHSRGNRDLLEDLKLRLESLDLVVQERIVRSFRHPGRARQHDHRRLFRICSGNAIAGRESPYAVRDANAAKSMNPRVRVGRKPGIVFPSHADQLDRTFIDQLV